MVNESRMDLADMEIDDASLGIVQGGFGWFPAKQGHPALSPGRRSRPPINFDVDINITIINIEGDMNVAGGQDVTIRG